MSYVVGSKLIIIEEISDGNLTIPANTEGKVIKIKGSLMTVEMKMKPKLFLRMRYEGDQFSVN